MRHVVRFENFALDGTPIFRALLADGRDLAVIVNLDVGSPSALRSLAVAGGHEPEAVVEALTILATERLEREAPRIPPSVSSTHTLWVALADVEALVAAPATKHCDYQIRDGRDLYCTASHDTDHDAVRVGLRVIAPTASRPCLDCGIPDARIICTHLTHAVVGSTRGATHWQRIPIGARCDLGHNTEAQAPRRCRPGEHACWERVVVDQQPALSGALRDPLAFAEALHFLDTVWRLTFKTALIEARDGSAHARIAQPAANRSEVRSRLSDLADVLKSVRVVNDLLPADKRGDNAPIKRLQHALDPRLSTVDQARLAQAIAALLAVNDLRNADQHASARDALQRAVAGLGIQYPPADWSLFWEEVRGRAAEALTDVRRIVDGLLSEGQ
jgi:hypothetical protein